MMPLGSTREQCGLEKPITIAHQKIPGHPKTEAPATLDYWLNDARRISKFGWVRLD
jgi:hypothetical protein